MNRILASIAALLSAAVPGFCGFSTVPEPSTDLLLGTAIIGFGAVAVYRSRKKNQ